MLTTFPDEEWNDLLAHLHLDITGKDCQLDAKGVELQIAKNLAALMLQSPAMDQIIKQAASSTEIVYENEWDKQEARMYLDIKGHNYLITSTNTI